MSEQSEIRPEFPMVRLNRSMQCPGCKFEVNPFFMPQGLDYLCECPVCAHNFTVTRKQLGANAD